MNNDNEVFEVSYDNIAKPTKYTIAEVAERLGVSTTKINHWIFKLNKAKEGFFENPSVLSEVDFEKIELAQELLNDGLSYDDVVKYFKDNSHGLVNRENNSLTKDLTKMDSQVISKAVTLEVKRHTDRVIDTIRNELALDLTNSFKDEAAKIAQISLEVMSQSKNEMISEIKELKTQNDTFKKELERMYSKQTEDLRRKLEQKEKELEESKKKKGVFGWFR